MLRGVLSALLGAGLCLAGEGAESAVQKCEEPLLGISRHEACLHLSVPFSSSSPSLLLENTYVNSPHVEDIRVISVIFPEGKSVWKEHAERTGGSGEGGEGQEAVDAFLTPRPWWYVHLQNIPSPSGDDSKGGDYFVQLVHMPVLDHALQKLSFIQFPESCENKFMTVKRLTDYNEYGNELGNVGHAFRANRGNIFVEYVDYGAHWVDKKTECPHISNQFLCSFLGHANCFEHISLPTKHEPLNYFAILANESKSTFRLSHEKYESSKHHVGLPTLEELSTVCYLHQQKNYSVIVEEPKRYDHIQNLFYIGMLFRKNYFYRYKVDEFLSDYYKQYKNYDVNEKCITFHVRRGDRVIAGKSMIDHCQWIEEKCKDAQQRMHCMQAQNDYYGLGCHTAIPYGALSFDDFVQGARYLKNRKNKDGSKNELEDVKMIVVMTNDYAWAKNYSVQYEDEWNFRVLPQPLHFRGSSVAHGVNNQGSLEAAQQCSALVGHTASAFTQLVFDYMCFRHGPLNSQVFGQCPIKFDFNQLK